MKEKRVFWTLVLLLGLPLPAAAELRLYVVNAFNGSPADATVSVVRLADGAYLAEIELPITAHAHSVAVHPDGTKAYVTGENSAITVLDTTNNTVLSSIATPENLSTGIAFVPGSNEALVCMRTGNVVRRIDTTTDNLTGSPIATSAGPQAVIVKANGTKAYVLTGSAVDVIDLTLPTPAVVASIDLGASAALQELTFDFPESYIYITDHGTNQLRRIRTSDNTEDTPGFYPILDSYPRSLSLSQDGALAYVGLRFGTGADSVWVVRLSDGVVLEKINDSSPFGGIGNPRKSVRSLDGTRLYVTSHTFSWVAEIDLEEYCFKYLFVGNNPVGLALADIPAGDNTDANPDPGFNGDGKILTDFGAGAGQANGVAIQCDGKVVMVGSANGQADLIVARYLTDGTLDPTFSSDGKDIRNVAGGIDEAWDVAIQPDGKIVVVGTAAVGGIDRFVVLRYTTGGILDGSFGVGGIATTDFGGHSRARAVGIQPNGGIVVVGSTDTLTSIAVARFTSLGILDPSFSGDGKVSADFVWGVDEGWDVAIQTDGKIVVVGSAQLDLKVETVVMRYTGVGIPDATFAVGGVSTGVAALGYAGDSVGRAVALQADGGIVVVGSTADMTAITVARLLADGTSDDTFDCDSREVRDFFWGLDEGWDVAIRQDGKIVVAGTADLGTVQEFVVLRYNGDGSLDWSLGGSGYAAANFVEDSYGSALAMGSDGTIVVVGRSSFGGEPRSALLRLKGWSDLLFGGDFEHGTTCAWSLTVP